MFNKKEKKVSFIFVLPKFRKLGIGSALIKHIDEKYKDKKTILYSSEMEDKKYLEKILQKYNWSQPVISEHFFKISNSFLDDPKLRLVAKVKMDLQPWRKEYIKFINPNMDSTLKPSKDEYGKNSLALFRNNMLIGWSLTKIFDHQQIVEYGKLFVKGEKGSGGTLLLKSIALQKGFYPQYNGYFKIAVENKEMLDIIDKHFSQHLLQHHFFLSSKK